MQANLVAISIFLLYTLQVLALPMELVPRSCKITKCMLSWTPTALSCLRVGMEAFAAEETMHPISAGICASTVVNLAVNPSSSCSPCYEEIMEMFGKKKKIPAPKKKPSASPAKGNGATVLYKTVTVQAQQTPAINVASAHHPSKSKTQPKTITLASPISDFLKRDLASATSS